MASGGTLAEGTLVAGKYRVVRAMATGGMGEVYEAVHDALAMRVALKVLQREQAAIPEAVERFLREARAAASLGSEHVAKVFDVGQTSDGSPYLAMELLDGHDLEQLLEQRGPLPVHEAVGYVLEALEALGAAHARGIVHRDIKPSNLFLARAGDRRRIKVLDFGISKLERGLEAPEVSLTSTRTMLGSPGYMSPEQVRSSKNVDGRTDLWSVGVILYELLTGTQAFVGETLGDVFAKIREEPLAPIRTVRPDVPEGLDRALAKCLERDRSLRFSSAAELAEALRPYAYGGAPEHALSMARETPPSARGTPASARRALTVETRTDWSTRHPRLRSGRWPIVLGAAVSLTAAITLGAVAYRHVWPASTTPPELAQPGGSPATEDAPAPEAAVVLGPPVQPAPSAPARASTDPPPRPSFSPPEVRVGAGRPATPRPFAAPPPTPASAPLPRPAPPSYDPDDLGI
jgi:serine/threonine-protein kinase